MEYISRHMEERILNLSKSYSAILVTGPRQAGKTTMLRSLAEKENIAFLNAAAYAKPSAADQEHMDPENHRLLAEAIYQKVIEIEGILE